MKIDRRNFLAGALGLLAVSLSIPAQSVKHESAIHQRAEKIMDMERTAVSYCKTDKGCQADLAEVAKVLAEFDESHKANTFSDARDQQFIKAVLKAGESAAIKLKERVAKEHANDPISLNLAPSLFRNVDCFSNCENQCGELAKKLGFICTAYTLTCAPCAVLCALAVAEQYYQCVENCAKCFEYPVEGPARPAHI